MYFRFFTYEVVSYYSYDDEAYIASIPALIGCAVDADTREEALGLLIEAKRDWIKRMSAAGHPLPAPQTRRICETILA